MRYTVEKLPVHHKAETNNSDSKKKQKQKERKFLSPLFGSEFHIYFDPEKLFQPSCVMCLYVLVCVFYKKGAVVSTKMFNSNKSMHHNQQKEYYKYREFCKTNKQKTEVTVPSCGSSKKNSKNQVALDFFSPQLVLLLMKSHNWIHLIGRIVHDGEIRSRIVTQHVFFLRRPSRLFNQLWWAHHSPSPRSSRQAGTCGWWWEFFGSCCREQTRLHVMMMTTMIKKNKVRNHIFTIHLLEFFHRYLQGIRLSLELHHYWGTHPVRKVGSP